MSILYIINKSPFMSNAFECLMETIELQVAKGLKIGVLLIQNAVIIAKKGAGRKNYQKFEEIISPMISHGTEFYALKPDLESRVISDIIPGIKAISYDEWIDLLEPFEKLMNIT